MPLLNENKELEYEIPKNKKDALTQSPIHIKRLIIGVFKRSETKECYVNRVEQAVMDTMWRGKYVGDDYEQYLKKIRKTINELVEKDKKFKFTPGGEMGKMMRLIE